MSEEIAHDIHAIHQRAFDHVNRTTAAAGDLRTRFFGVFNDPLRDAMNERMREPLFNRRITPDEILFFFLAIRLQRRRQLDHALGGIRTAIEHHVFSTLAQLGRQIVVHTNHAGVDDTHGHAGTNRVIQKDGMNGFARRIIATERETHIGDTTADFGMRQVLAYPARSLDKVNRIIVVLFDASSDGEDIRIKDDVLRREINLVDQQPIGAFADFPLACKRIRLALLVKGHHDHSGAVTTTKRGLTQEFGFAFFHRDGVHDRLALNAFQACLDYGPF